MCTLISFSNVKRREEYTALHALSVHVCTLFYSIFMHLTSLGNVYVDQMSMTIPFYIEIKELLSKVDDSELCK